MARNHVVELVQAAGLVHARATARRGSDEGLANGALRPEPGALAD